MRVDIEGGKYTYIFEDGRARLLRYGEPSRRDVVGDKLIYRMAAEISELRQQLADRDEQISDLTISSDTYFAERNSARDIWRRASKDRDELRQQLAALTMQCEKLVKWKHLMSYNDSYFGEHAGDLKRVVYEIDRSMPIRGDK